MTTKSYLQELAEEPIKSAARASKIWLPQGRKKAEPRPPDELAASRANSSARRAREKEEGRKKLAQLLDYYAQTDIPADRVAQHCGISTQEAERELVKRRNPA